MSNYLGLFSFWHLVRALHKLGSGQRSSGVCPFLFFTDKSAPLAAKKHAMEAEDFLSPPPPGPPPPRPMRSLPTSCMSWSWRSCDRVWCRSASWSGVSPSLSVTFRLAPSLTNSRTICNEENVEKHFILFELQTQNKPEYAVFLLRDGVLFAN